MKQLWAPWRLQYVGSPKESGCFFCNAAQGTPGQEQDHLLLYRDPYCLVLLNRYPYGNGHLLVCPTRHTGDPLSLGPEEYRRMNEALRLAVRALDQAYHPEGFNLGMNLGACAGAGVVDHLHWHAVPRWAGDTNFMPVLADIRSIPEHLEATWARLRPYFPQSVADPTPGTGSR